jgi:hypothetical protein
MAIDLNFDPYYDDFKVKDGAKDSNYMRILFKPGFSVQARELTQLQSIIQNQLKLFGDHIFQDGSPVIGGHLTLDTSVASIKLQNQFGNEDVFLSNFLNKVIINDTGSQRKRAYVLAVDDGQINKTLMIRYLRGNPFTNDEVIRILDEPSIKARILAEDASDIGSTVSINEGIFYVDGYFVQVPEQTIVLNPYSSEPTFRVGLEIDETIVDSAQDSTLLDPAQSSFNFQAPGADRYQFSLILTKRTLDSIDDSRFFELLRVENGIITKQVKYPIYSEIEKTLARRTFDESGNYTITPFRASATDHPTDSNKFNIVVDSGKAYIRGYEFETISVNKIEANRARTTSEVRDYDLSLEYGNYVTVRNLSSGNDGIFRTDQMAELDLHVVPTANINTSSAIVYNTTKVGSALVRGLQRASDSTYSLYILDQNAVSNTFTPTAVTATTIELPTIYSESDNAYSSVSISVLSGLGSGQRRKIASYDGPTRVATIDRPFDPTPNTSSVISLNYTFGDTKSVTVTPTAFASEIYAGQNPNSAVYPSMDIDPTSRSIDGVTFAQRTDFNRLLYSLPEKNIQSILDVDFYSRRLYTNQTFFANGVCDLLTSSANGESIYYGTDSQNLSSSQANTNVLVLVKNKLSSSFANGEILNLNATGAAVKRLDSNRIQIISGQSNAFTADVFVNVKLNDTESSGVSKDKELFGRLNLTALAPTDSPTTGTVNVVNKTSVKIHTANGLVWFTDTNDIVKAPGLKQSLYVSDVVKINKIFDSGNPNFSPNNTNSIDVTNRYLLDTGQRDNYYDHASIILKSGQTPPTGQTVVSLMYYDHGISDGYASGASYGSTAYDNDLVPVYSSSLVKPIFLGDAIDFRPIRINATTAKSFKGLRIPYTELSMELNYSYFVSRIDKLIATQNRELKIITGIPSKYPKAPEDDPLSMSLYTIYIPAFTKNVRDVKFDYVDNRRYTMRDIGKLESRIERVEYYTQLSLLEQEARNETFLYEDRVTEKEKYGILVDQFDGFNIADNKNTDLLCNISFNELKPYKRITPLKLSLLSSSSNNYLKNDRTYSLAYDEIPAIEQSTATKSISVQPYLFGSFQGQIQLRPEIDNWVSTSLAPEVITVETISNQRPPTAITTTPAATEEPTQITQQINIPAPAQTPVSVVLFTEPANTLGFETPLFNTIFADLQATISSGVGQIETNQIASNRIPARSRSGFQFRNARRRR